MLQEKMSYDVPLLARLGHEVVHHDRDWVFHRLPKENVEIPREHIPDAEADAVPASGNTKQESFAELERQWQDTGLDRIHMQHAENGTRALPAPPRPQEPPRH